MSRRLTEALREQGVEATMLVLEKRSHSPFVVQARYPLLKPLAFLAERLQIFLNNGLSRRNLFKADTGAFGLPLWRHPVVKEADAVILNWVNQGMLSLGGVRRIAREKRVIWTMHDQWNMTGVCHYSQECRRFEGECGNCPLLGGKKAADLSRKTWRRKRKLYAGAAIQFVAVSRWLAGEAAKSELMKHLPVAVIPNPFRSINLPAPAEKSGTRENALPVILFAAASLDNYMKGLDTFREAVNLLAESRKFRVILMGAAKDPASLGGFRMETEYAGNVTGDDALAAVYSRADVLVNSSSFENLPGTLVEAQAYGAIPVTFDRGGQSDIIDHLHTGYLAPWSDAAPERARNIADGITWALEQNPEIRQCMKKSVEEKFSYASVAGKYIELLKF